MDVSGALLWKVACPPPCRRRHRLRVGFGLAFGVLVAAELIASARMDLIMEDGSRHLGVSISHLLIARHLLVDRQLGVFIAHIDGAKV